MTVEEFLDWPGDGSRQKFELVDGELRAMAPANISHGIIQANLAGILRSHLIGSRCYVVVGVIPRLRSEANMRVPDLAVSCEALEGGLRAAEQRVRDARECLSLHDNPHRPCQLAAIYENTHLSRAGIN
jgi:Uma2 family endonuclease